MNVDPLALRRFLTGGITQSAVRLGKTGKGIIGVRAIAREFCSLLPMEKLPRPEAYLEALDRWTEELKREFPKKGSYWGIARKCLNIFFRDASYNVQLREIYPRLRQLESVLEVPLDSYTAKGLLKEDGASDFGLKRWDAIIRLTPDEHSKFQEWASIVAKRESTFRVHLDLRYFPFP